MDHELDPFDALVNIEEECIQRGREEGIKVGEERGFLPLSLSFSLAVAAASSAASEACT